MKKKPSVTMGVIKTKLTSLRGKNCWNWKGGKYIDNQGYVLVYIKNHPNSIGKGTTKYILEHRLVMEKKLGRYLLPYETVHHINGDKTDNRIENLDLWSSRHPKGVRVETVICPHCGGFISLNNQTQ